MKAVLAETLKAAKAELWAGDELLATEEPWTFEAKLKPGIRSLYAVAHRAGAAARSSRPHTVLVVP